MISYVAKALSIIALTIQKVLITASFIGRVIVAAVTGISLTFCDLIQKVTVFFQIIYEDNVGIVTEDIPNLVHNITYVISEQILYFFNCVIFIYQSIDYKIRNVAFIIKHFIYGILNILYEVILLMKNSVIFLGDTIWFIITFIPVHLPQVLQSGIKWIKDTFVNMTIDTYMGLLKITNFLTDVPLESFAGIISIIIIIRLIIHYRETMLSQMTICYWSLVRKIMYLYYMLYNYFTDSEVRVITHMAHGQDVVSPRDITFNSNDVSDEVNQTDALCVICQERQKCVLTLPCRHVCLCTECCRRLYAYQRTCPICRTFIYHSVTIYL